MKRAAVSIPPNIAEGFKRFHEKEYRQYLFIAQGSIAELQTQIFISRNLSFINKVKCDELNSERDSLARMITALIKKFK